MIVERSLAPGWLSNTWLVADRPGGHCVLIDTGGPMAPIVARIAELSLTPTHVLCTHHHVDHVAHNADYKSAFGCPVCGGAAEREWFGDLDRGLQDGDELRCGALTIRALAIPGHTIGQLAFLVDEERVFTGDTLFRRSVGGTRGPGHASFAELERSVLETLMRLPHDTLVHPGHTDSTTIGEEWAENPFVRLWRGLAAPAERPCRVGGAPATLLLRARDYDGGTKCQVRFPDGRVDVVPGSRVEEG